MKCAVEDGDPEMVPNFSCNAYLYYISGVFAQLFMHLFHFAKNVCSGHGMTVGNYVYGYQNNFKWTKNVTVARLVGPVFSIHHYIVILEMLCLFSHTRRSE